MPMTANTHAIAPVPPKHDESSKQHEIDGWKSPLSGMSAMK